MNTNEEYITAEEGCVLLCVSYPTFCRLKANPTFPRPVVVASRHRWSRAELVAWRAMQTRPLAAGAKPVTTF